MSENKFIKHLRGEQTAKSVLELKNQRTTTSFANMPEGTSNANEVYSDPRGNATAVLKGTDNWKLNGSSLVVPTDIYGDGRDVTGTYDVAGQTLWINASYTFPQAKIFTPNTKWVLKLCGNRLLSGGNDTIPLTLLIKFGATTIATKAFTIKEHAFNFSEELVVDFAESNTNNIKVAANSTMTVQVLCGDATATAQIYNGMTVFTALQRRVDADVVASDEKTFDEVVQDIIDISEELDNVADDLADHIANKTNPHEVTKSQVGLGNCDNTSDLDKPISTATQNALDGKVSKSGDTMTGALKMRDYLAFQKIQGGTAIYIEQTSNALVFKQGLIYNNIQMSLGQESVSIHPYTNGGTLGKSYAKWETLYASKLNNGADLVIPNKAGTLATMGDVELAARSGTQLTAQGVWYAKMYAATVAPAAEDGTNYADFSQVDGQGNPIIVTYNRVNGAWVQDQTITPPAEYDGYVIVTSKIWDIAEQTGQQGGRVLWNHTSKEFTPYPQIISFENINVTGNSTVDMPQNPGANQIVNKGYVDEAIASIPTPTEVIDAEVIGALTINGSEVSGFGFQKNLVLPGIISLDVIGINSFEIGGSFTTPADFDSMAPYVIQGIKANTASTTGGILIRISSTDMVATIAPDGAPVVSMLGSTTLNTSTEYWFKLLWDGTTQTYSLLLSADGETFATIATKTDSVRPADATYTIGIGDGYTYIAAVDMEDWYIKRNGQIVWQGMNVPGLATKANVDLSNVLNNIDFVVESQLPTAANNYTWYRKYKSGWVEQGGMNITVTSAIQTWTLPVTMADTHYAVQFCKGNDNGNYAYAFPDTVSTIKYKSSAGSNQTNCAFVICGMAA
jgi:hypothetical protein